MGFDSPQQGRLSLVPIPAASTDITVSPRAVQTIGTAWPVNKIYWHSATPASLCIVQGCLYTADVTETVQQVKPKILTIWTFMQNFANTQRECVSGHSESKYPLP